MNIDHALTAAVAVALAGCAGVQLSGTSKSAHPERLVDLLSGDIAAPSQR
jgi:hypothetical protein